MILIEIVCRSIRNGCADKMRHIVNKISFDGCLCGSRA